MSCHWKTLEMLSLCVLQKQCFFTEDVPTNQESMNRSSLLVLPFLFLLCSPATKVQAPGVRKTSSNISSFFEKKNVNNYGHCKKMLLPPACWGKPMNLKTVLTVLSSSQWSSLYVYVIMGRDYTPSFLCHICSLN